MAVHLPRVAALVEFEIESGLTSPHLLASKEGAIEYAFEGDMVVDFSEGLRADGKSVFQFMWDNAPVSSSIAAESQLFNPSPRIMLFQLDLTRYGLGIAHFTPHTGRSGQPIRFGGQLYTPFPVEATNFEWSSQGQLPRPKLSIGMGDIVFGEAGAAFSLIRSLVLQGNDLLGCEVRRIITHEKFLDDGDTPASDAMYPVEIWRIERKTSANKHRIEFELASVLDNENSRIPARQMLRDVCFFIYRWWDADMECWRHDPYSPCPYMGEAMFDTMNQPTEDPAQDVCSKRLEACRLRHARNAGEVKAIPYGGFPGMARMR